MASTRDTPLDSISSSLDIVGESLHATMRRIDEFLASRARGALPPGDSKFRALFDAGLVGITIVRPDGSMVDGNAAFTRMLGYDRDEARSAPWPDLARVDRAPTDESFREAELAHKDAGTPC